MVSNEMMVIAVLGVSEVPDLDVEALFHFGVGRKHDVDGSDGCRDPIPCWRKEGREEGVREKKHEREGVEFESAAEDHVKVGVSIRYSEFGSTILSLRQCWNAMNDDRN